MKLLLASILLLLGASSAEASRCTLYEVGNRVVCCDEGEQAIVSPQTNRLMCFESESQESCVWNPVSNRVQCCNTDEEAVYRPVSNRVQCCSANGARGQCR